jgi:DNA-binding MarR family transcriptional regulator
VPPTEQDLRGIVDALLGITADLDRARRRTPGGGVLSLLQVVARHEGIRPAAIAERLHVDSSLAARRVRVCEDAGFVKVSPDPADRRSVLVAITPAGSEELRRLERPSLERIEMLVADWEPDQVRTLTGLLANLGTSVATLAARERRSRRRRFASDAGLPDWFVQWLGG